METSLCDLSLAEVSSLLRAKRVSPVQVTAAALHRIAEQNPRLNAFLAVTAETAAEQAREAEAEIQKGDYRGPLHGVPVAVKDLIHVRGVPTTAGTKQLANLVPGEDAAVIEHLRRAGAVLLGKTALHEFAYGITNDNPHYGPTRNPWDPQRTSGGSSGGSGVAVAAGLAFVALGTDTGGSIRIPASFCGVAGLKPTFGRVSVRGVLPLGHTLDHVGPLARTVEDAGLVYHAIAGFDPDDPFSVDMPPGDRRLNVSIAGLRVGVPEDYFFAAVQPEVERLVREACAALEERGAKLVPVKLSGMAELTDASRVSLLAEAFTTHRKDLELHPDEIGGDVKALLEKGREVTAEDYIRAQLARQRFRRQFEGLFQEVDVLAAPTTPLTAFRIGGTKVTLGGQEEDVRGASTRLLRCFNATGNPALSLCCGFDAEGMPVGLQIIGRRWDEASVLRCGNAYEQAAEGTKRRPPV